MTIQQQMKRREFKDKVNGLDLDELRVLFEQLKADTSLPIGPMMYVAEVYARKANPIKL